jgi:hypothetical protein
LSKAEALPTVTSVDHSAIWLAPSLENATPTTNPTCRPRRCAIYFILSNRHYESLELVTSTCLAAPPHQRWRPAALPVQQGMEAAHARFLSFCGITVRCCLIIAGVDPSPPSLLRRDKKSPPLCLSPFATRNTLGPLAAARRIDDLPGTGHQSTADLLLRRRRHV